MQKIYFNTSGISCSVNIKASSQKNFYIRKLGYMILYVCKYCQTTIGNHCFLPHDLTPAFLKRSKHKIKYPTTYNLCIYS